MRKVLAIILVVMMAIMLPSCKKSDESLKEQIQGKTYTWEEEGFGSDFTITFNEDNTYEYYEGNLSSYLGAGNWKVEDGVLVMTETAGSDAVYKFDLGKDELKFRSDSDDFMYVKVEEGSRFTVK